MFGPLTVFDGNRQEFESGVADWLSIVLPVAGLAWAGLTLTGMSLRNRWRDQYLLLILAVGFLIWAQSTFLVHDYGDLDGRGLDWQAFSGAAGLDILLWIGLPWLVIANRHRLKTLLVPIALLLVAVQLLAAIEILVNFDQADWFGDSGEGSGPPESLFEFSREHNIVHLGLDNFQTDVFQEIVDEEGLESAFDGFVLFPENAAAAPYTNLAIPSILPGRSFEGRIPNNEFYKRAATEGLPSRLHDLGYRVNLNLMLSLEGARHSAVFRIPATFDDSPEARARKEALQALDIMLFRSAPHLARNWVYNDNNWRIAGLFENTGYHAKAFVHRNYLRS